MLKMFILPHAWSALLYLYCIIPLVRELAGTVDILTQCYFEPFWSDWPSENIHVNTTPGHNLSQGHKEGMLTEIEFGLLVCQPAPTPVQSGARINNTLISSDATSGHYPRRFHRNILIQKHVSNKWSIKHEAWNWSAKDIRGGWRNTPPVLIGFALFLKNLSGC